MLRRYFVAVMLIIFMHQIARSQCSLYSGIGWQHPRAHVYYNFDSDIATSWYSAIATAASQWNNSTEFPFFVQSSSTNDSIGMMDLGVVDCNSGTLAKTFCYYDINTDTITHCSTFFNTEEQYWSAGGVPQASQVDVATVMTHEFGLWLHLDESSDPTSIMYQNWVFCGIVDTTLTSDVSDCITALYNPATGVCENCPPAAPSGFHITIVGQNVVLGWDSYTDPSAWELEIVKNGQPLYDLYTSSTSYVDDNGVGTFPASYQVGAFNEYGDSYSPTISAVAASTTISSNTTWSGVVYVPNSVVVNSGNYLDILLGTKVIFNAGQSLSLTSNGTLHVEGTSYAPVTFTSNSASPSSGNWGSIVLNGSGANGSTINYADIDYGTEVKVNQANNVTIENCNIYDNYYHGIESYYASDLLAQSDTIANANANHGILITGGSSNNCYQNIIYKTNHGRNGAGIEYAGSSGIVTENDIEYYNWGIGAIWGASPTSYVSAWNGLQRNNRITNCIYGLMVYHQSYPNFGPVQTSPYSYNSIYSNTYNVSLDADNYNTYALPAAGNYWATSNPTPTFVVGSGSQVNWQAVDAYDPWSGVPLPTSSSRSEENHVPVASAASRMTGPENEVQGVSSSPDLQDSLLIGVELRDQKKCNEARSYFMALIARHPDAQAAYVDLYSCADSQSVPAIINFFRNLPPQASEEQKLLLANLYMEEGKGSFATQVNDETIIKNPNTSLAAEAELSNFYIDLNVDNDPLSGAQILAQVEGEASLLEGTELSDAESALKLYVDPNTGKMPNMGSQQSALGSQPQVNGLVQNYPNPFNPTTVISYNLRTAGNVTLNVYDVLGRKVMTLVSGYQSAGIHSAEFNGDNLASGVYFYRLTAPGISQIKKMILLK